MKTIVRSLQSLQSVKSQPDSIKNVFVEVGKLADMVILDKNPLTVTADAIHEIKVVETIREGKTIYLAK